jgi:DUF1680 family protein
VRNKLGRRDFLKAAPAAAGFLALGLESSGLRAAENVPLAPAADTGGISSPPGMQYTPRADYPIQAKPFWEVKLTDDFWAPRRSKNATVTIPFEFQKFEESGRQVNNNVLEAAIYSLRSFPDPVLQAKVDTAVAHVTAAPRRATGRATNHARNDFFEVAAAYYVTTGNKTLLDAALQSADSLYQTYFPNSPPFSGGERDAVNCIQLYTVTKDKRHLDLAKNYLDIRGLPNSVNRGRHNQSYKPVLEQTTAVGHAVNGVTLMVSLVDVGTLTGLQPYSNTARTLWLDTVSTKLYITGGVGSSGNEGFLGPYMLPNLQAYSETCAGIMFSTLNHKMFLATGDAKYIDVMERSIYNNVVDGVSFSGDRFFYVNRLASAGDGRDLRWQRASLECCPPNLVRFMASMPKYIYAQSKDALYVNLYVSSEASFAFNGGELAIAVDSEMPWGGKSKIKVVKGGSKAQIKLRIPGWARNQPAPGGLYSYLDRSSAPVEISVNGKAVSQEPDEFGYLTLERVWRRDDVIAIEFPFEIRTIVADARVRENSGRFAVSKGPVVFAAEWPDYQGGHVLTALMNKDYGLTSSFDKSLYSGATVIQGQAKSMSMPTSEFKPITLVPYHLWANRGQGQMAVWLSQREYAIGDVGPAGGFIFYVNPHYQADGWRYLEAAPRDQSAGAKWGCFRTSIPGASGTAIGTGKQNTLDMKAGCAAEGTAADLCINWSWNGFQDWFLPSIDELTEMYQNLKVTGLSDFGDASVLDNYNYWSSSQVTTDMARHCDFADNGIHHYDDKDFPRRVRAIRAF